MKKSNRIHNAVMLSASLLIASAGIYLLQLWIFRDAKTTVFYLMQDLAFVPVNVFLVTFFINQLLSSREKRNKTKKINVTISTFFIEMGTGLIRILSKACANKDDIAAILDPNELMKPRNASLYRKISDARIDMSCTADVLTELKAYLSENKTQISLILENPHLLEHDSFTDMLWAVFHMSDELNSRDSLDDLPQSDLLHLAEDARRAYRALIIEWISYIRYLRAEYPYLHSLAVRRNPFEENADARILN